MSTRTPEEEAAYQAYLRNDKERQEMNVRFLKWQETHPGEDRWRPDPVPPVHPSEDMLAVVEAVRKILLPLSLNDRSKALELASICKSCGEDNTVSECSCSDY